MNNEIINLVFSVISHDISSQIVVFKTDKVHPTGEQIMI
jgi:hypothetical protein